MESLDNARTPIPLNKRQEISQPFISNWSSDHQRSRLLVESRWLNLRPLLKASSILGLVIGGIGSWETLPLVGRGLLASFLFPIYLPIIVLIVILLLFGGPLAFVSALCLTLLLLNDEQNNILGFLCLMGSVTALVVFPLFALFTT